MSDNTGIEWCTTTWNPVTGCSPVSSGCAHCFAKRMASRLRGRYGYPKDDPFKVTLHPDKLGEPLHWRKPRRVFVCSMGDLFHKDVPDEYIEKVFGIAALRQEHTFLMLTKRPDRMLTWFNTLGGLESREICVSRYAEFKGKVVFDPRGSDLVQYRGASGFRNMTDETVANRRPWPGWPLPNVHLGASISNQEDADRSLPLLLQTPAAVRFVSYEPALGPVDFNDVPAVPLTENIDDCTWRLDQVICGAETGPGARPMDLDWARSVRDQCAEAGVAFFMKSVGRGKPIPKDLRIREYPNAIR